MSYEGMLFHYRSTRSRFLEADAHLDQVLAEATDDEQGDGFIERLERARTLAVATYEDYSMIRKRLLGALLPPIRVAG